MRTIHKFPLAIGLTAIPLPSPATVLCAQMQRDHVGCELADLLDPARHDVRLRQMQGQLFDRDGQIA